MALETLTQHEPDILALYQPEVLILPTPELVDLAAGSILVTQIESNPNSIITPATGSSPVGAYQVAIKEYRSGLDMSGITTTNLDQYWPLPSGHSLCYQRFMDEHWFNFVNIPSNQRHIPDSTAIDPHEAAARYERVLNEVGPSDLVILGIGPELTCHIAFNERGSKLDSRTRVVDLDNETIQANARFCEGNINQVPTKAITQGIANILEGKKIILIAKGVEKAEGIKRTLEGEIGPDAPASFLRFHSNVTFLIDQEAASLLNL